MTMFTGLFTNTVNLLVLIFRVCSLLKRKKNGENINQLKKILVQANKYEAKINQSKKVIELVILGLFVTPFITSYSEQNQMKQVAHYC